MKKIAILSFAVVAGGASAQVLYAQNGFATGNAPNGNNISESPLTTATTSNTGGYGASPNTTIADPTDRNRVADDFTVTGGGWKVSKICVYGYVTGAGANNDPFGPGNLKLWSTLGGPSDSPIASTTTMANGMFTGVYRTFSRGTTASGTTNLNDATRAIWKKEFVFAAPVMLGNGTYWADYQVEGRNASGAAATFFVPFLMQPGNGGPSGTTLPVFGNGKQRFLPTGTGAVNGWYKPGAGSLGVGGFDVAFGLEVKGEVVPEPATMAALGLGLAGIAARRRRKA